MVTLASVVYFLSRDIDEEKTVDWTVDWGKDPRSTRFHGKGTTAVVLVC